MSIYFFSEQCCVQCKCVNFIVVVIDVISGKLMGFFGNFFVGGMLLICQQLLCIDVIYQLQMLLYGFGV